MNIELAKEVLTHIKIHQDGFDMDIPMGIYSKNVSYIPGFPCGTVACLAGWTILLNVPDIYPYSYEELIDSLYGDWEEIKIRARELLEISIKEADYLFDLNDANQGINKVAIENFEKFILEKEKEQKANFFL